MLVEHSADPVAGGRTPSDFPLAGLTQREIEGVERRFRKRMAKME